LQLVYRHGDGRVTSPTVDPLGLVAKAHVWYLVAIADGNLRVVRISRIQDATALQERFVRPANFDLPAFWTAWRAEFQRRIPAYHAVVRAAAEALPRLQQLLGEEVKIYLERAGAPDALGRRAIPVTFERFEDARRALMHCGAEVEALEPEELRAGIRAQAAALAALYDLADPAPS
jgi:predicted DNA-binding transcriptional regulator YafY